MKSIFLALCSFLSLGLFSQEEGVLLGTWSDSTLQGSSQYDNTYNEIWAYATEDFEMAIIGSTFGTHFIDVTDPQNPIEKFRFAGAVSSPAIIHRDYHDHKGFLYAISDEGSESTLQIFDLRELPDTVRIVYDEATVLARAHNIFIDTSRSMLYTLIGRGGVSSFDPLRIYDISDPINPVFVNRYGELGGVGFSQVHDAYIDNDTAFLNLGPHGVMIADFGDKENPEVFSYLSPSDYPQSGYNHSGWPTDDLSYYYFADETWGKDLKAVDIRDIRNMNIASTFNAGSDDPNSIAHNQIVACDKLYVSYYYDGLQVYDLSSPDKPERMMYYNTTDIPYDHNYQGAWGVYPFLPSGNILVSDMQNGLFVIEAVDAECNSLVAVNEIDRSETIEVYPNPNSGEMILQLEDAHEEYNLSVIDMSGRSVSFGAEKSADKYTLRLDVANGMYIVCGRNADHYFHKTVIVQN